MKVFFTLLVFFACTQTGCSQTDDAIRKDFNQFEINEDEALDGNELKACQCQHYDANGDGVVSYAEYKAGRKGAKAGTATAAGTGAYEPGTRVEVAMGEYWYKATVVAVKGEFYKVEFPGEAGKVSNAWIGKAKVRSVNGAAATAITDPVQAVPVKKGTALEAGTKVEILYEGTWYPGYIMEVKGEQYKIHYDGYGENWDSWLTKDKLRVPGGNQQPGATAATNTTLSNATFGTGGYYAGLEPGFGWRFYYFLPGNKLARGCIQGGLEFKDPSTFNTAYMATYSREGNKLTIHWNSGSTERTTVDRDGAFEAREGLFVKQNKVSPRLSANYSWSNNTGGAANAETYQFREDGRFIVDKVSGFDNNDGRWGGETASNKKGSYNITGYTITLTFEDGTVKRHTIFTPEEGKNPETLGWDCGFMSKSK